MSYYGRRYSKYDLLFSIIALIAFGLYHLWTLHPVLFSVIAFIAIPLCILGGNWLIDLDYKSSIKNVRISHVKGQNTIANAHCTIKYEPDKKIIVMENIARQNQKRMFTLQKKEGYKKINKGWSEVCRVFDDYTTFQSLLLLLDVPERLVIYLESKPKSQEPQPRQVNIDNSNIGPKFVEMGAVVPDKFGNNPETHNKNKDTDNVIYLNSIKKAKPVVEQKQDEPDFVEMNDVLSSTSKKIDVNNVEASELSILPGINIVQAKKLIEYRNTNGLFKSVEDFISVANVKPHFASQIKSMIVANTPQTNNIDEDNNEGRIIDF